MPCSQGVRLAVKAAETRQRSSCWNSVDQDRYPQRTPLHTQGAFAPEHLGGLTQAVPFDMVDEALAETRASQSRVQDLRSRVVVYLLLAAW